MQELISELKENSLLQNVVVALLFFLLNIPLAVKVIPYFTVKLLKKKNKAFIARKVSAIVQEICEFLFDIPFKDNELNAENISIFTQGGKRFVGFTNINVYNKIVFPKISLVIHNYFDKLSIEDAFLKLKAHKEKIDNLRLKLEEIVDIHSLHLDENIISHVSNLCLEIRAYDIRFRMNNTIDDLIETGQAKREGIFGIHDLFNIYEMIFQLLQNLTSLNYFEYEIKKSVQNVI